MNDNTFFYKIYISLYSSKEVKSGVSVRETGRGRLMEDLKDLDTAILTYNFFITTLCHTQIQGCTSLSRHSQPVFASCSHSGNPRLQTETEDCCRLLHPLTWMVPSGCSQWLTATLGYLYICNFIMLTQCSFSWFMWAASACLDRCVLQSLCLHSWNIQLCQVSVCNKQRILSCFNTCN